MIKIKFPRAPGGWAWIAEADFKAGQYERFDDSPGGGQLGPAEAPPAPVETPPSGNDLSPYDPGSVAPAKPAKRSRAKKTEAPS